MFITGVYRDSTPPQVFIDVKDIPELVSSSLTSSMNLGGNMTLTDTVAFLDNASKQNPNFSYASVLAEHIRLIANPPVRNVSSYFSLYLTF